MIELNNVSKNFGTFKAVDDISFKISKGEIVGLLGPNGAGKTTTMRMLTGYYKPTSGTIKIDNKDLQQNLIFCKNKIGYMIESAALYPDMIVEDYLKYICQMHNIDSDKKIAELVELCDLSSAMHKNIGELSKGFKQRVGLAQALVNDPAILILDEPTSGLDPNQIEQVRALIKQIGKTRTVIVSTHILQEVENICDRVIIINKGKIAADSPTSLLKEQFGKTSAINLILDNATLTDCKKAFSKIEQISSITKREDNFTKPSKKAVGLTLHLNTTDEIRDIIFTLIVKNKWTLYEMTLAKNSLEDIFHTLTS